MSNYLCKTMRRGATVAFIRNKKIKGKDYLYLTQSGRVDGQPKHVAQMYLGAEAALRKYFEQHGGLPKRISTKVLEFGATVALYSIAQKIQVIPIIDAHVPKRDQGLSVGEYLLIAAINRALDPTSKNGIAEWFEKTVLGKLMGVSSPALTSQDFWNNMDKVATEAIPQIEEALVERIIKVFEVDISDLLADATNFFSFIDTLTESELAKRGNSKEKRADLRIMGLFLTVARDGQIPIFSHLFPGNVPDVAMFTQVIPEFIKRLRKLRKPEDPVCTFACDKGYSSKKNLLALNAYREDIALVGSFPLNQHSELLDIPLSEFTKLNLRNSDQAGNKAEKTIWAFSAQKEVHGRERQLVLTFNPALQKGQLQGLDKYIEKASNGLVKIQERLENYKKTKKGRKPTVKTVESQVSKCLSAQYLKQLFEIVITESKEAGVSLQYRFLPDAYEDLKNRVLGKTLLFTDYLDRSMEQTIQSYRALWEIESVFKQMKDDRWTQFRPVYHWTDHKIRVHTLICLIAIWLSSLMLRELRRSGINLSLNKALKKLSEIQQVEEISEDSNGGKIEQTHLTDLNKIQQQMFNALGLDKYLG